MNRQPFPSIVLSVSIVFFFAVALYRRDGQPPKFAVGKASAPAGAVDDGGDGIPRDRVAVREAAAPAPPPSPAPIAARGPDATAKVRPAGLPRGARPVAPAVRGAADRGIPGARPMPATRKPAAIASRPSSAKAARPALTVSRSGETIADVARRVYGTASAADGLWRANRDVLRDPGAEIPPGTVLHTPPAPPR